MAVLNVNRLGKLKTGKKGGHVHAFPFDFNNPKGPKHTPMETLEESHQAATQGKRAIVVWWTQTSRYC